MNLKQWGWPENNTDIHEELSNASLVPGRIIGQGKDIYTMAAETGTYTARISGAFQYRAALPSDYPVVGDFVAFRDEGDQKIIEKVLPRKGALSRQSSGNEIEEQVMAANVDTVFLVFALDGGRNFNPHLLERMLTLTWNSGALPVVVLNKSDLCTDRAGLQIEAEIAAPGVEILFTSTVSAEGLEELKNTLASGKTHFFFGKSGVGKSSLINSIAGYDIRKTSSIRDQDKKGRHTTTSRDLLRLPGGALLIDSPGLREFALWSDEESVDAVFPEIMELSQSCRFRDCGHTNEPGCSVQAALTEGTLPAGRYESYLAYRKEVRYVMMKTDENLRAQEDKKWKDIAKLQRSYKKEQRF